MNFSQCCFQFRYWKLNSFAMFLFLFTIIILPNLSQQQPKFANCAVNQKCDACIRTFGCIWCADPNYTERRCQREADTKCPPEFIQNPRITAQIIEDMNLTVVHPVPGSKEEYHRNEHDQVVQVQPQKVYLTLRPNEGYPKRIWFYYRQAEDYPIDLYYLMDLSNSMSDDKEKLTMLGGDLVKTMTRITSNFRLGFGSFVDKVVMPFVNIAPWKLAQPCDIDEDMVVECVPPYSFRHHLSLNQNSSTFADQVREASISGNLDAPEGGFDAIMQAVVCKDNIGWRNNARKLLVFSTDSSFHVAGDGKLAGIIRPNDGCCHLDNWGYYTHSSFQDYPSVSQINLKVKENSINMIFAVTEEQILLYEQLGKYIEGSSCGILSNDSSNIVDLVIEQYEKITSSIELRERGLGNYLRVRYYSRCLDENGPLMETNKCDGLTVGKTVKFDIDVEMLACPPNRDEWIHEFSIYPVGVSESMIVQVQMQCDCDCALPENVEINSARCSGHGTLKCGICECNPGFSGEDCSCYGEVDKTDNCRPNSAAPICSDRGVCKCNKCDCSTFSSTEVFWGDYCQCANFTCPQSGGKLCSDHGKCICGKCVCEEGWIGENCACENSTVNCIGLGNEICSGHGVCECNKCVCDQNSGYYGKFCERCPSCPSICNELKDCVECKVHGSGLYSKEECEKQCNFTIDIVEVLEVTDQDTFCSFIDDKDCRFTFKYEIIGHKKHVTAQKNKECPPQAYIPGVVFSVISSIVLIGLAFLLLWKVYTSMQDRREFAKFEKERMMAKWDAGQNPIFKQATSTFRNPTYCRT